MRDYIAAVQAIQIGIIHFSRPRKILTCDNPEKSVQGSAWHLGSVLLLFCSSLLLDRGKACQPSALRAWVEWGGCPGHGCVGCPSGAGVAGSRASWRLSRGLGEGW